MEWITILCILLLIIASAVIIVFKVFKPVEAYSPKLREVVKALVVEAAPKLEGKEFNIDDVRGLIGDYTDLDATTYYFFKKLIGEGKLTEGNLLNSILKSSPF